MNRNYKFLNPDRFYFVSFANTTRRIRAGAGGIYIVVFLNNIMQIKDIMKKLKKQERIIERIIYLFLILFIAGSFSVGVTLIFLFFKSPELEVVNIEKSEIIEKFVLGVILGILVYTGLISNKKNLVLKSKSEQ